MLPGRKQYWGRDPYGMADDTGSAICAFPIRDRAGFAQGSGTRAGRAGRFSHVLGTAAERHLALR